MPTTFSVARAIVKKDGIGLNGLNKGLTATIGRNGVFNMIYFGFYHSVKDFIPAYQVTPTIFIYRTTSNFFYLNDSVTIEINQLNRSSVEINWL